MIGKYYSVTDLTDTMYFVERVNAGTVYVKETMNFYIPNSATDIPVTYTNTHFQNLINIGKIVEIEPPTFFIVTTRKPKIFKIIPELKKAGARWVSSEKFWYFNNKPDPSLCTVKEVLVYPFTGKRIK